MQGQHRYTGGRPRRGNPLSISQALTWVRKSAEVDWFGTYLGRRGLERVSLLIICLGATSAGSAALIALLGPADELYTFGRPILIFGLVLGSVVALRALLRPFPKLPERLALIFVTDFVIGAGVLAHKNPVSGLAATSLFVIIGMLCCVFYVDGLVHILHSCIVVTITCILVSRSIESGVDARQVLPAAIGIVAVSAAFLPLMDFYIWQLRSTATDTLIDPLTRLSNRRGVVDYVQNATHPHRARSVLIVDVDSFKPINDQHGHAVGDRVLVEIARTIESVMDVVGGDSLVARTGGDEFAIITDLDARSARRVAERIRLLIEETQYPRVTASIGIGRGIVSSVSAMGEVMNSADAAMYIAKRQGGNQVREVGDPTHQPNVRRRT